MLTDEWTHSSSSVIIQSAGQSSGCLLIFVLTWRLFSSLGLLVVYCHRFDILTQSSRIYFATCTIGKSSVVWGVVNDAAFKDVMWRPEFTAEMIFHSTSVWPCSHLGLKPASMHTLSSNLIRPFLVKAIRYPPRHSSIGANLTPVLRSRNMIGCKLSVVRCYCRRENQTTHWMHSESV